MKCTHCNSEWNSANPVTSCPFCGKPLTVKPSAQPTMESVLEKIRDRIGVEALENNKKMLSCFADLAPQLKRERRVLQYFAECNGPELLYRTRNQTEAEQIRIMGQIVHKMNYDLLINETIGRNVCETYLYVLTRKRVHLAAPTAPAVHNVGKSILPTAAALQKEIPVQQTDPNFEIDAHGVLRRYHGNAEIVTLPANVVKIGSKAFYQNESLRKVYLPESLTAIDEEAFGGCHSLSHIYVPDALCFNYIYWNAFSRGLKVYLHCTSSWYEKHSYKVAINGCLIPAIDKSDGTFEVPEFVTDSDGVLLRYHGNAEIVTVPPYVIKIERWAFSGNINIRQIYLPDGLLIMDCSAFSGCTNLSHVHIPDTLYEINYLSSFPTKQTIYFHCSSAWQKKYGKSIYTPEHNFVVTPNRNGTIETPEFVINSQGVLLRYNGNAKIVTIPPKVVKIWEKAFYRNKTLQQVNFPEGLTEIGEEAFAECPNLQVVKFPSTLKIIKNFAFRACHAITHLTIPGGVQKLTNPFFGCINLTQLVLQYGIQSVEDDIFNFKSRLSHVYVPDTLRSIGSRAFPGSNPIYVHCSSSWQKKYGYLLTKNHNNLIPVTEDHNEMFKL